MMFGLSSQATVFLFWYLISNSIVTKSITRRPFDTIQS